MVKGLIPTCNRLATWIKGVAPSSLGIRFLAYMVLFEIISGPDPDLGSRVGDYVLYLRLISPRDLDITKYLMAIFRMQSPASDQESLTCEWGKAQTQVRPAYHFPAGGGLLIYTSHFRAVAAT